MMHQRLHLINYISKGGFALFPWFATANFHLLVPRLFPRSSSLHFTLVVVVATLSLIGLPNQRLDAEEDGVAAARELYKQAASALIGKSTPTAIVALSQLVEKYPEDDLAPLAALRLAECHLSQGSPKTALSVLQKWNPKLASSPRAQILEPGVYLRSQLVEARAHFMAEEYDEVLRIDREQIEWSRTSSDASPIIQKTLEQLHTLAGQATQKQEQQNAVHLRAAADQVRNKQFNEALKTLELCKPDQLSGAWLWRYRVLQGQSQMGNGHPAAALRELDKINSSSLSESEQVAVRMTCLDAAIAAEDAKRAQTEVEWLQKTAGKDPKLAPTVALRAVEAAMLRKERTLANQLALAARQQYADYVNVHEFDFLRARNALASIEFTEARRILQSLVDNPPQHDPTALPRAHWLLGESYFLSQDYKTAIAEYSAVVDSDVKTSWAEAALMQRGKCHELQGEHSAAADDYRRLVKEYAQSSLRASAQERLVEVEEIVRSASTSNTTTR